MSCRPPCCPSIVNLAHGLKLKVVAEGAETEAQLAILREAGGKAGKAQDRKPGREP
ncbi:MAG: hypothetical protein JWP72_1134 [Massilia sp.]|nr:hypothetical protein [Massilia sp.]MDB5792014.1 hypothetical protein [Massilia sp.]